jgi:hypothetical protein
VAGGMDGIWFTLWSILARAFTVCKQ